MSKSRNAKNAAVHVTQFCGNHRHTNQTATTSSITMQPASSTPRSSPVFCAAQTPRKKPTRMATSKNFRGKICTAAAHTMTPANVPHVPGAGLRHPAPKKSANRCAGCAHVKTQPGRTRFAGFSALYFVFKLTPPPNGNGQTRPRAKLRGFLPYRTSGTVPRRPPPECGRYGLRALPQKWQPAPQAPAFHAAP